MEGATQPPCEIASASDGKCASCPIRKVNDYEWKNDDIKHLEV